MKYIFTIHSPITFFTAYTIFKYEELSEKDVIVISYEYKMPMEFGTVLRSFSENFSGFFQKIKSFNVGKAFDKYIEDSVGDNEFIAFIDIMHTYQKLLVSHPKCKVFHFFEEGTDSYMQALTLEDFTRTAVQENFRSMSISKKINEMVRTSRGYTSGLHSLPYHAQSYQYNTNRKYYCLSDFCYPGIDQKQKIVLKPNFEKEELDTFSSKVSLRNAIVIIEETYPKDYKISDADFKRILSESINRLNSDNKKDIYVKLRPVRPIEKYRLVGLLEELKIEYSIIPNEALAEGIFFNSTNLYVLGFVSSLLMYAKIFGHQAFSMIELLPDRPKSRFDSINGFPELVEMLK